MRIQTGSQSWPNLAPREGKDSELDPCLAWVRKGAESGDKERQIRRPFHPDVQFLRIRSPDEKGAEIQSSAGHQPLAAFISQSLLCLLSIYSSHPTSSPSLLMHLWSQVTVDICHATLPPLPRPLQLRPRVSIPKFPRYHQFHVNLDEPQRVGPHSPVEQAWRR
jgi:hypothetical protein